MAFFSRKGDILSVHVGRLEVARVKGMGTIDPRLQVRTRGGFWRTVSSIDDEYAEKCLLEWAHSVEWALSEERRGRA